MDDQGVPTINVATLRSWLEQQRPVLVLDVRPTKDRAEWSIPGNLHVDASDSLWQHDPQALADVDLPQDVPVVVVCNAGRTSLLGAKQLQSRGIHALSLEGGMNAWSLAWNIATVGSPATGATVIQVRRTGKGCLSYIIGSDDVAAVIDASLPPEVYLDLVKAHSWKITHVFDTHVHADHLSRSRVLAQQAGAKLFLPAQRRVTYPFTPVHDYETFEIGRARLTALHTPGHTYESTCYLLDDGLLFSGDTLFTSAVGRPDLLAGEGTRERAEALHASLQRLLALNPSVQLLAGHSSEPIAFDGQPHGTPIAAVRTWLEPMLVSKAEFVETILSHLPSLPPNYEQIVVLNEAGQLPEGDPTELEAGANRCAVARPTSPVPT